MDARKIAGVAALLLLPLGISCQAQLQVVAGHRRTWTFDKDRVGEIPKGWQVAETAATGTPAKWEVVADGSSVGKPNAVALTSSQNRGRTFNLLLAKNTSYRDLRISVMVKAGTGKEDQGGGPMWRAQDPNNYYIARWNPLEKNFRAYFVKDGKRKQLGSADVKIDPNSWHEIEIEHKADKIKAKLDGKLLIEVEDKTFEQAGMIGLWTKADAATAFDNISVTALRD
jgi:hypothetical protein